ncbi:unnamed protein product [Anisakis simplex]|uniref:DOCKER domain-containing protein n=1 Tax=Anisakis simplex TaxID=6269 RepID=A0A3P6R4D8_ANISI|nr:unnamed protein product [Anisakis simplex]
MKFDDIALVSAHQAELASIMPRNDVQGIAASKRATVNCITERLGRPGSQTGVALARLLGQKGALSGDTSRFERGLAALSSFVTPPPGGRATMFDKAVQELIGQLRGVLSATGALADAINDPIRLADLRIQLANSYRGSAALRCTWFETLAETHIKENWFSEAAENFASMIEKTMQTLVLAERYEAIGPLSRLAIPIFEQQKNYRALVSMYADLQQAYSSADQVKATRKRHFGSYFRVIFHEWIYREPALTSLAEACERMSEACRLALGHERIQVVAEGEIDESQIEDGMAYVEMTHVQPFADDSSDADVSSFALNTNIRKFIYECPVIDESVSEDAPEIARRTLKRICLTVAEPFPNTRRRERVTERSEKILTPLELAIENLIFKAQQIRRILDSAINAGDHDKTIADKLDVKGLQLLLQGAVQPTMLEPTSALSENANHSSDPNSARKSMHILDSIGGVNT